MTRPVLLRHVARRPAALARAALSRGRRAVNDAGMATAEYAVATMAAVGFAGLLVTILRGSEVRGMLLALVKRALNVG